MKTIQEINEKIKKGIVVVLTAEEMKEFIKENGYKEAANKVDVVTTGTFGPMCSSGAYLNLGHTKPRIKLGGGKAYLNEVEVYTGFAAVDIYIGASSLAPDDPRNKIYPGEFKYGGGHVIEDLVKGKDLKFKAIAYGTDCYPRKNLETLINIKTINEAVLFNPRNCYQNYNVAVNSSNRIIYTYLGMLRPNFGNANYCSAGSLSPLLNDPYYKTIGIGTKIFLGGGIGYVAWWGTQHNPTISRTEKGIPLVPAGTLAVIGDLKQMTAKWLRGVSMLGYGTSLAVGIGIPIPIIDEEMAYYTGITDEEIFAPVVDYSKAYPERLNEVITKVSYAQLRSGKIKIMDKEVPTASLSSYAGARKICKILKEWIMSGKFFLTEPVAKIPDANSGYSFKPLEIRQFRGGI
ncbi:MAG: homocysteine biosynthesis protein [Candidatus Omnitrophica bacterium]|nr:homocysteine biosynthesis protein [Candidatus Omnitrophota bacterium]MCM8830802.1 homocysteine biosynthesis protein [Candidatus Omnitrophota bacterium]